jgi:hypothetical protein
MTRGGLLDIRAAHVIASIYYGLPIRYLSRFLYIDPTSVDRILRAEQILFRSDVER